MPRNPSKPGLWFWSSTRIVDAFHHGKGKHRINDKMSEMAAGLGERDSRIGVHESTIEGLLAKLDDREAEIARLLKALHMEDSVNFRRRARTESPDGEVDTTPMAVVSTN